MRFLWDEQRKKRLKELWGRGYQSTDIASELTREFGVYVSGTAVADKIKSMPNEFPQHSNVYGHRTAKKPDRWALRRVLRESRP